VVGKQTLVELNTAAILIARDVFAPHVPALVHPKSARSGLGINRSTSTGAQPQTRDDVKAKVLERARELGGWQPGSDDEADAFFVAAFGVRVHMAETLAALPNVRAHFAQCHATPAAATGQGKGAKAAAERDALLALKCKAWSDDYFFDHVWPHAQPHETPHKQPAARAKRGGATAGVVT